RLAPGSWAPCGWPPCRFGRAPTAGRAGPAEDDTAARGGPAAGATGTDAAACTVGPGAGVAASSGCVGAAGVTVIPPSDMDGGPVGARAAVTTLSGAAGPRSALGVPSGAGTAGRGAETRPGRGGDEGVWGVGA